MDAKSERLGTMRTPVPRWHRRIAARSALEENPGFRWSRKLLPEIYVSIYTDRTSSPVENDMPSRSRVAEFLSYVEAGKYVEAISDFYAESAFMRENGGERSVEGQFFIHHERLQKAS